MAVVTVTVMRRRRPMARLTPAGGAGGEGDLLIWTDDIQAPSIQEAADAFGEENGITVKVESIAEELQTQFVTAAQAGNAPDLVTARTTGSATWSRTARSTRSR